jgi:hypothetical protein
MVVVTSEGLVRVDGREGRSASGDCEGDSNKYEDFSHGRILSKKYRELYHTLAKGCDRHDKKLRRKFNGRVGVKQKCPLFPENGHGRAPRIGAKQREGKLRVGCLVLTNHWPRFLGLQPDDPLKRAHCSPFRGG